MSAVPRGEPSKQGMAKLSPRRSTRSEYTGEQHTGWVCGICGANAKPDNGFTLMDPRYNMGYCPKHRRVGLIRG